MFGNMLVGINRNISTDTALMKEVRTIMNLTLKKARDIMSPKDDDRKEGDILISLISNGDEKFQQDLTVLYRVHVKEKEEMDIKREILDKLIEVDNYDNVWNKYPNNIFSPKLKKDGIQIKQEISKQKMKESLKMGFAIHIGASNIVLEHAGATPGKKDSSKYFMYFNRDSFEFYLLRSDEGSFKNLDDNSIDHIYFMNERGFLDINSKIESLHLSTENRKISLETVEQLMDEYLELVQEKEKKLALKISEAKGKKTNKEKKEEAINDWFSM